MNLDKVRKLHHMGLGPVWVRRQDPAPAAMDWDALEDRIRTCRQCGLCEGRKHAVPGVGDRAARWLFVGEGPGRNEDM